MRISAGSPPEIGTDQNLLAILPSTSSMVCQTIEPAPTAYPDAYTPFGVAMSVISRDCRAVRS
ncbi:hypothetical protein Acor_00870 [Acrocarpospora corrugata]|uniref:Uncharacterized protein n=1 Tax=Acrocarpospora corrugata TaxID=35763 RepID=A0A5M3VN04_9ACTN|nr:hypothetical protein [Acrocarpospora corrugata]GER98025.1 hypothetical protein Acor_00870 [Acrocarpospora corrugata]